MTIGKIIYWTNVKYASIATFIVIDVTNPSVIVKINYCGELVFRKSLGGECVTTTVKMPSEWPVHLCIAAGLTPVEAPHSGSGKFPKVHVHYVLALAVWSQPTVHICGDHKQ